MNEAELKTIEEQLAQATPGVWRLELEHDYDEDGKEAVSGMEVFSIQTRRTIIEVYPDFEEEPISEEDINNFTFIAPAPATIRALLAEVKRLQGLLAAQGESHDLN
jgi:hypothetical protein